MTWIPSCPKKGPDALVWDAPGEHTVDDLLLSHDPQAWGAPWKFGPFHRHGGTFTVAAQLPPGVTIGPPPNPRPVPQD